MNGQQPSPEECRWSDHAVYFGTIAAGWIFAIGSFAGWRIPHLFSLDVWWKWVIAIPLIMAFSAAACFGFFVWLAAFGKSGERINAKLDRAISARWPLHRSKISNGIAGLKVFLFLPWILAFIGWSMNYGS